MLLLDRTAGPGIGVQSTQGTDLPGVRPANLSNGAYTNPTVYAQQAEALASAQAASAGERAQAADRALQAAGDANTEARKSVPVGPVATEGALATAKAAADAAHQALEAAKLKVNAGGWMLAVTQAKAKLQRAETGGDNAEIVTARSELAEAKAGADVTAAVVRAKNAMDALEAAQHTVDQAPTGLDPSAPERVALQRAKESAAPALKDAATAKVHYWERQVQTAQSAHDEWRTQNPSLKTQGEPTALALTQAKSELDGAQGYLARFTAEATAEQPATGKGNRGASIFEMIAGGIEVGSGAAIAVGAGWTGLGAVGGGAMVADGAVRFAHGANDAARDEHTDPYLSQLVQAAGMSRGDANRVDALTGLLASLPAFYLSSVTAIKLAQSGLELRTAALAATSASSGLIMGVDAVTQAEIVLTGPPPSFPPYSD